jgi:hypothetical protein
VTGGSAAYAGTFSICVAARAVANELNLFCFKMGLLTSAHTNKFESPTDWSVIYSGAQILNVAATLIFGNDSSSTILLACSRQIYHTSVSECVFLLLSASFFVLSLALYALRRVLLNSLATALSLPHNSLPYSSSPASLPIPGSSNSVAK